MSCGSQFDRAEEAARAIQGRCETLPRVGVVLGSGLGGFTGHLRDVRTIDYADIPHFPSPTVAGHGGCYVQGKVGEVEVGVLSGRFHYYEGHSLDTVTLPIRVLRRLGTRFVVLTASVGGISPLCPPGQVVAIIDHLNLLGENPLRGRNDERLGTRFPDMTEVYSRRLLILAAEEARRLGVSLVEGVYAAVPGPSYETPAEVRMLRGLGADVVGMSIVPEAVVARHAGMEVLGLALVSNAAAGLSAELLSHDEVIEAGKRAGPRLAALIEAIVPRLEGLGPL